jgi:beta-glucosidase
LNVGYRYYDREQSPTPLFPFGFGLSYTTFQISDAKLSAPEMSPGVNGIIELSCAVTNTGDRYGKFVVQLYVQSPRSSIGQPRPVKELKAFVKVGLEKGQSERVTMKLDKYSVSFYDEFDCYWRAQKGAYNVLICTSATDVVASMSFAIPQSFTWTGV